MEKMKEENDALRDETEFYKKQIEQGKAESIRVGVRFLQFALVLFVYQRCRITCNVRRLMLSMVLSCMI
jgi:hypothetical protein